MGEIQTLIDRIESSVAAKAALVDELERAWAAYDVPSDPNPDPDPDPDTGDTTGISAAPFWGDHANGTYSAQVDITFGGDTYVATLDSGTSDIHLHHAVSATGSFAAPALLSTSPTDGNTHAAPCVIATSDGGGFAFNGGHNQKFLTQSRMGDSVGTWQQNDISGQVGNGPKANFTYTIAAEHHQESGKPLYLFTRMKRDGSSDWGPHVSRSTDGGATWSEAVHLLSGVRPYIVAATHAGRVTHLFTNRGHPDKHAGSRDQGVYHAEFRNGKLYRSSGAQIKLPADPHKDLDTVSPATGNAWVMDAAVMPDGRPCVTWVEFTKSPKVDSPREFWWARREADGTWTRKRLVKLVYASASGSYSYGQPGVIMDRQNPERVFLGRAPSAGKPRQVYRYTLSGGDFGSGVQVTGFTRGISGIRMLETRSAEPKLLVTQSVHGSGYVETNNPTWTGAYRGSCVVVPSDKFSADLPDAT